MKTTWCKKNITNTFICPPGQNAVIDGQCIGMCLVNILVSFKKQLNENFNDILAINQAASLCVSRSIARGVYHASNSKSDIFPSFKNKFKIKVS